MRDAVRPDHERRAYFCHLKINSGLLNKGWLFAARF